jgi:hypothetical protein
MVKNTFISVFISSHFNISFVFSMKSLNINECKEDTIIFRSILHALLHNRHRPISEIAILTRVEMNTEQIEFCVNRL